MLEIFIYKILFTNNANESIFIQHLYFANRLQCHDVIVSCHETSMTIYPSFYDCTNIIIAALIRVYLHQQTTVCWRWKRQTVDSWSPTVATRWCLLLRLWTTHDWGPSIVWLSPTPPSPREAFQGLSDQGLSREWAGRECLVPTPDAVWDKMGTNLAPW